MIFLLLTMLLTKTNFFLHGPADTFDENCMFSCLRTIDDEGFCRY